MKFKKIQIMLKSSPFCMKSLHVKVNVFDLFNLLFFFLDSTAWKLSFDQKKKKSPNVKWYPKIVYEGGRGLNNLKKIILGGKYLWILAKLSENISRVYLPPYRIQNIYF